MAAPHRESLTTYAAFFGDAAFDLNGGDVTPIYALFTTDPADLLPTAELRNRAGQNVNLQGYLLFNNQGNIRALYNLHNVAHGNATTKTLLICSLVPYMVPTQIPYQTSSWHRACMCDPANFPVGRHTSSSLE